MVDNIQNFASYSDFQPVNYLFKLQNFNGDGLPSEEIHTLRLTIKNPFYIRTFRIKKAAHIFKNNPDKSVSEVMYSVGFSSLSHFTNAFKKEFGITPTKYKKGL